MARAGREETPPSDGGGHTPGRAERTLDLLLELGPRITRLENEVLAHQPCPLTLRQYRILRCIDDGVTSPTAMSRVEGISLAAISQSLDALHRRELVGRTEDAADRRALHVSLTWQGREALARGATALRGLARALGRGLESSVEQAHGTLTAVARNAGAAAHPRPPTDRRR